MIQPRHSNNLHVWIFGSSVHRQCSSVVFDDVKKAFDEMKNEIEFVDDFLETHSVLMKKGSIVTLCLS